MIVALLLAAALEGQPATIELFREGIVAPPLEVTSHPDKRIELNVEVVAPDDRELEALEIRADNQQPGYWEPLPGSGWKRPGPNVFVEVERVSEQGERLPAHIRVTASGGGSSLRRYDLDMAFEIVGDPAERRARIVRFFAGAGQKVSDAQIELFDHYYLVANPPGTYAVTVEYRPVTGTFGGRRLRRQFSLRVEPGPDVLDRILQGKR